MQRLTGGERAQKVQELSVYFGPEGCGQKFFFQRSVGYRDDKVGFDLVKFTGDISGKLSSPVFLYSGVARIGDDHGGIFCE